MSDKELIKSFIEDLKEQLISMYNIELLSMKETNDYKLNPIIDNFIYIEIKLLGGYSLQKITVIFRFSLEDLKDHNGYLHMLEYFTLDFGGRVYDLFFGRGGY